MSDFAMSVNDFTKKAVESIIEARKQAQKDVGEAVVTRNPVDSGLSSGNWIGNKGAPATYSKPLYSTQAQNVALAQQGAFGEDGTWYLVNNVDYSYYIEFGSSTIRPHAMARKGVQEVADKLGK